MKPGRRKSYGKKINFNRGFFSSAGSGLFILYVSVKQKRMEKICVSSCNLLQYPGVFLFNFQSA